MHTEFDPHADAMYFRFTGNPVGRTVQVSDRIAVDLDGDGNLRGFEVLFVSRTLADVDFGHLRLELPNVGTVELWLDSRSR